MTGVPTLVGGIDWLTSKQTHPSTYEVTTMQLTYRGIQYNAQPSVPAHRSANTTGKYRGVAFTFSNNQPSPRRPQCFNYRGSHYSSFATVYPTSLVV
jgi:hypothetical protein